MKKNQLEQAIFAGGCFWCMIQPFTEKDGIISVSSGYTGGNVVNPSYEDVCRNNTGHTEAVKIIFDPSKISYKELLDIYWRQTDPTDAFGQFQDRGDSYRAIIFYNNEQQKTIAEQSKKELQLSGKFSKPIVTKIEPEQPFYLAEDYHQDYHKKNPELYENYHNYRKKILENIW
ncbi:peptide-methionine (S)-S-oxide reductase MsrA [Enterococcus faecalis]|nr:peptide-methionine (S)-S-oxide reductase MsrA [Enterococcus faecalis]